MLSLYTKLKALRATRDQGVTATEYALILVGIALAILGTVYLLGGQIITIFQSFIDQTAP